MGEILLTCDKKVAGRNRGFRDNGDIPLSGKVIGEFVCDDINITDVVHGNEEVGWYVNNMHAVKGSLLDEHDILNYCPKEATVYGWHISELKIYDNPKELSEFFIFCGDNPKCDGCEAYYYSNTENGIEEECCSVVDGCRPLKRPPQSWCYIEGKEGEGNEIKQYKAVKIVSDVR